MPNNQQTFFVSVPRYLEKLLMEELKALNINELKETQAGVFFYGGMEEAYKICLYSRLASRVYLSLHNFTVNDEEDIYSQAKNIDWLEHFEPENTFFIDVHTSHMQIKNSHYAALKMKDAVVDYFREKTGSRPTVANRNPDIRLYLYIDKFKAHIYLDLAGESLYKRGYRQDAGEAPLRENLAAALLVKADWFKIAAAGGAFIDPLCGSGTIAIEAALMAASIAPGLFRKSFGFSKWKKHNLELWLTEYSRAEKNRAANLEKIPLIFASDNDQSLLPIIKKNIKHAGLVDKIIVNICPYQDIFPLIVDKLPKNPGLIITNPPYGKRLGDKNTLKAFYNQFGNWLKQNFPDYHAAILTDDPETAHYLGLRAAKINTFYKLLRYKSLQKVFYQFVITDIFQGLIWIG